jgi:KipI family sensor histidine kinase inhibitor
LDAEANAALLRTARSLRTRGTQGITDVVPGYASLLVEYEPALLAPSRVKRLVDQAWHAAGSAPVTETPAPGVIEVGVVYDGPDLARVAESGGLTPAEVIQRHAGVEYRAYAVGFTPGFAYLGDVDPALRTPRLSSPRPHVPAGSVGIADSQTGVYPLDSPGGWNIIGTATVPVFDPRREPPELIAAGDRVRFLPVSAGNRPRSPEPLELLPGAPTYPTLRVLEPGLLDLVVDEGRFLAGHLGFARSGPIDAVSARIANGLVANPAGAPLLEMNVAGPTIEVLRDAVVALAGSGTRMLVNGVEADPYTATFVPRGSLLRFPPRPHQGRRSYLALASGIESGLFMGSASTDVRGLIGRQLAAGAVLGTSRPRLSRQGFSFRPHLRSTSTVQLRLLPGPQFSAGLVAALLEKPLRILQSDRMGVRLEGVAAAGAGVVSEGNPLGAVQLTSGGDPIILLNDRGTVGGYTKPAIVDPRDLPRLAQARDGTFVRFVVGR